MADSLLTSTAVPTAPAPREPDDGRVQEVAAAVAARVRALRTDHGWSMDELARRSGVSKGMVVQVEGARTNPSVGTLCRLADACGVTVSALLEPVADRTVRVSPAADAPVLWRGGRGGYGRLLRAVHDPARVELWDWRLAPGESYEAAGAAVGTRIVLHLLAGAMAVTAGSEQRDLHHGDTASFPADRPYLLHNAGLQPVRLVLVSTRPTEQPAGSAGTASSDTTPE